MPQSRPNLPSRSAAPEVAINSTGSGDQLRQTIDEKI